MQIKIRGAWFGIIAALGGLAYGYDTGAISGALLFLKTDFHLTSFQNEALASIASIGMMLGALGGGILADRFGRRTVLVFTTLTLMVFTILNGLSPSYNVFLISRFLVGFTIGIIITVTPVYISEFRSRENTWPSGRRLSTGGVHWFNHFLLDRFSFCENRKLACHVYHRGDSMRHSDGSAFWYA